MEDVTGMPFAGAGAFRLDAYYPLPTRLRETGLAASYHTEEAAELVPYFEAYYLMLSPRAGRPSKVARTREARHRDKCVNVGARALKAS